MVDYLLRMRIKPSFVKKKFLQLVFIGCIVADYIIFANKLKNS